MEDGLDAICVDQKDVSIPLSVCESVAELCDSVEAKVDVEVISPIVERLDDMDDEKAPEFDIIEVAIFVGDTLVTVVNETALVVVLVLVGKSVGPVSVDVFTPAVEPILVLMLPVVDELAAGVTDASLVLALTAVSGVEDPDAVEVKIVDDRILVRDRFIDELAACDELDIDVDDEFALEITPMVWKIEVGKESTMKVVEDESVTHGGVMIIEDVIDELAECDADAKVVLVLVMVVSIRPEVEDTKDKLGAVLLKGVAEISVVVILMLGEIESDVDSENNGLVDDFTTEVGDELAVIIDTEIVELEDCSEVVPSIGLEFVEEEIALVNEAPTPVGLVDCDTVKDWLTFAEAH